MLCMHYFSSDNPSFNFQNCFTLTLERLGDMLEDSTSRRGILQVPKTLLGVQVGKIKPFMTIQKHLHFFFFCVGARTAVGESAYCLSTNQGGGSKKGQVAKKASPLRKILDEACQLLNVLGARNMKFVHWG